MSKEYSCYRIARGGSTDDNLETQPFQAAFVPEQSDSHPRDEFMLAETPATPMGDCGTKPDDSHERKVGCCFNLSKSGLADSLWCFKSRFQDTSRYKMARFFQGSNKPMRKDLLQRIACLDRIPFDKRSNNFVPFSSCSGRF